MEEEQRREPRSRPVLRVQLEAADDEGAIAAHGPGRGVGRRVSTLKIRSMRHTTMRIILIYATEVAPMATGVRHGSGGLSEYLDLSKPTCAAPCHD